MFPVFCLQDELVACSSNNSVKHTLHSPIRAHAIAIHMPRIFAALGGHINMGVHNTLSIPDRPVKLESVLQQILRSVMSGGMVSLEVSDCMPNPNLLT